MKYIWLALVFLPMSRGAGFAGESGLVATDPVAPRAYEAILQRYVAKRPVSKDTFETVFDYERLAKAKGQAKLRATLRDVFLSVDPGELSANERTAWAINAYNFFVIDAVMEAVASGKKLESIRDLAGGDGAIFDDPRFRVGDVTYSLNRFENHFLFGDADRAKTKLPEDLDPRLHFAIVCAAVGCPPLWPEPFRAKTLDAMLDRVTRNALAGPRQLQVKGDGVHVSQVFSWYAADFEPAGGVAAFLTRHAPPRVAEGLKSENPPAVEADIPWDWTLNRP